MSFGDVLGLYQRMIIAKEGQKPASAPRYDPSSHAFAARYSLEVPYLMGLKVQGRNELFRYQAHHALMLLEFEFLLEFLKRHEYSALFFKGIRTSYDLYSNPVLRPSRDIDVLIRPSQKAEIINKLFSEGYVPRLKLSSASLGVEQISQHALELYHPERGIVVDVHWSIGRRVFGLHLDSATLFSSSVSVAIADHTIQALHPIHDLVVTAVCAARENWQKLHYAGDMYLRIEAADDLDLFLSNCRDYAKEQRVDAIFEISLELMCLVLSLDRSKYLPKVEKSFSWRTASWLFAKMKSEEALSEFETARLQFQIRSGLGRKITYVAARLFVPHDSDWQVKVPGNLWIFHFVRKPLKTLYRIAVAVSSSALRKATSRP